MIFQSAHCINAALLKGILKIHGEKKKSIQHLQFSAVLLVRLIKQGAKARFEVFQCITMTQKCKKSIFQGHFVYENYVY